MSQITTILQKFSPSSEILVHLVEAMALQHPCGQQIDEKIFDQVKLKLRNIECKFDFSIWRWSLGSWGLFSNHTVSKAQNLGMLNSRKSKCQGRCNHENWKFLSILEGVGAKILAFFL